MIWVRAGWLSDITNWLREQIVKFWEAIEAFFNDLIVNAIEQMLELIALAFEALPVPDFLTQYSVGSLLSQAGPEVAWAVSTFKIAECCSLLGSALVFRVTRKIVTFGKW